MHAGSARADVRTDPKIDAKQACATAADRGQSRRDEGKYAEAREALVRCSATDCPKIVSQACGRWLRDLDDATPTFVVGAQDEGGHDLTDVAVTLDGAPIATKLDGQPHPADPGAHTLKLEARDRAAVEQRIVLRSGEKHRVFVVKLPLRVQSEATGASGATGANGASGATGTSGATEATSGGSPQAVVGVSLAVVAVAAAVVGGYFIAQSIRESSDASDMRAALPSSSACAQTTSATCSALSDTVDAHHRDAWIGGAFVSAAGLFALGAAATLLFWKTTPNESNEAAWSFVPSIDPHGGAALGVKRSFL